MRKKLKTVLQGLAPDYQTTGKISDFLTVTTRIIGVRADPAYLKMQVLFYIRMRVNKMVIILVLETTFQTKLKLDKNGNKSKKITNVPSDSVMQIMNNKGILETLLEHTLPLMASRVTFLCF